MGEVQRLIDLPSDVMTNISSFLLGTPQQLKLHNNKALRQLQNKHRFIIEEIKEESDIWFWDDDDDKQEIYGYKLKNNNYSIKQVLNIIKKQNHNLYKRLKIGQGRTNLLVRVCFHQKYIYNTVIYNVANGGVNALRGCLEDRMNILRMSLEHHPEITNFKEVKFIFKQIL